MFFFPCFLCNLFTGDGAPDRIALSFLCSFSAVGSTRMASASHIDAGPM